MFFVQDTRVKYCNLSLIKATISSPQAITNVKAILIMKARWISPSEWTEALSNRRLNELQYNIMMVQIDKQKKF